MLGWLAANREALLALGPVSSLAAAIAAVIVTFGLGLAQWRIARSQRDIARDNLLLAMFDRKYEIYRAGKGLAGSLRLSMKRIPYEDFPEWQVKLSEAVFYFPRRASKTTSRIVFLSSEWERLGRLQNSNEDAANQQSLADQKMEIVREMEKLYHAIDSALLPYMTYRT